MQPEDKLKDIAYVTIAGCDCFKRNWKYYFDKNNPRYIGLTLSEAEINMKKLINDTFKDTFVR